MHIHHVLRRYGDWIPCFLVIVVGRPGHVYSPTSWCFHIIFDTCPSTVNYDSFITFFRKHFNLVLIHLDKLNFCCHLHQPLIQKFYLYFITGGFYMSEAVTVKVLCLVAVFFQGVSGAAIPTPLLWFPEFFWVLVYW